MQLHTDFQESVVSTLWALFLTYVTALNGDVERHLELGKQLLSKGQFADALTHYHAAVDADPDNYQTLYRRATVYLALGRAKPALNDLDRVVELKPEFSKARQERAGILLKLGHLDEAHIDYEMILRADPKNSEAMQHLAEIEELKTVVVRANDAYEQGDFELAIQFYSNILDVCPWFIDFHERRGECLETLGQYGDAIADVRAVSRLKAGTDSTGAFLKLSLLHYKTGDTGESLKQIRECLKLDPDHKDCFAHYKSIKKLAKLIDSITEATEVEAWPECVDRANKVIAAAQDNDAIQFAMQKELCKCYTSDGQTSKAVKACTAVIELEETVDAYCNRADAYLADEQFDDAVRDFEAALKVEDGNRRAQEGLQRAQKMRKQSQRRDYYKILNVKRNASKKQILKAYRKLAQQWHPDNFSDDDEKKKAEAKFIDIASAKEVLTDPEKRSQFDNGEDPLDHEAQHHGGHGFPHGFNPFGNGFGGGNFNFKFNF